jgi:very-short-patch-repair endonuclease
MGSGCPECAKISRREKRAVSKELFIVRASNSHGGKYSYEKVNYVNNHSPVVITCPVHGDFYQKPVNHIHLNNGCPQCSKSVSSAEQEISSWLQGLGFNVVARDRKMIYPKEIDIFLPDQKIAIEYNGLYHHSSAHKQRDFKMMHLEKLRLCESQGIRLLQFWDCEWINKKDICKEIILFSLGKIGRRIFARKCKVHQINSRVANSFLEINHIQGHCSANYRIGLFLEKELVGVQCYAAPNKGGVSGENWLLVRTAFLLNTQVVGGISKMFQYFLSDIQPHKVVDYTDRRLFIASGHHRMGFLLDGITPPCSYLTDGYKIYSRRYYRYRGDKHFKYRMPWDNSLSDSENLERNKWYWIYDCGKIRSVWEPSKTCPGEGFVKGSLSGQDLFGYACLQQDK